MATIVEGPKPKRVKCKACEAIIEYLPEEVRQRDYVDIDGSSGGQQFIPCPRPGCPGEGIIRSW